MSEELQATLSTFAVAVRALLQEKDLAYVDPSERALVARIRDHLHGRFVAVGLLWF